MDIQPSLFPTCKRTEGLFSMLDHHLVQGLKTVTERTPSKGNGSTFKRKNIFWETGVEIQSTFLVSYHLLYLVKLVIYRSRSTIAFLVWNNTWALITNRNNYEYIVYVQCFTNTIERQEWLLQFHSKPDLKLYHLFLNDSLSCKYS